MNWFALKRLHLVYNVSVFLIASYFFTIGGYLFYEGVHKNGEEGTTNMIVGVAEFLVGIWVLYGTPALDADGKE